MVDADVAFAWVAAAGLGALVGAVEIFQRYRAEPLDAVANRWGALYVTLNAVLAIVVFGVFVNAAGMAAGTEGLALVKWGAIAGLGSSAILRAKLLNLKLADGKEVALGPEIVVQTCLGIMDRELDRERAQCRFDTVRELFTGIDFERAKVRLPLQVFQAMQTVSEEETQSLMKAVAEVDDMKTIGSQDKSYLLGFYLLDLVGDGFLRSVLKSYRDDFTALPPALPAPPTPAALPGPAPAAP